MKLNGYDVMMLIHMFSNIISMNNMILFCFVLTGFLILIWLIWIIYISEKFYGN
jgi:hypothetical protein